MWLVNHRAFAVFDWIFRNLHVKSQLLLVVLQEME
jgi:hypothetical protein